MTFVNDLPPIDDILTSVGRVKILTALAVKDQVNITAITQLSGLNHTRVTKHLDILKEHNIVVEKRFGRIKIYRINRNSVAGKRIYDFLKKWYLDSNDDRLE